MKKLITIASLAAGIYGLNAHALLTSCQISVDAKSYNLVAELGHGTGTATCSDITGNTETTPLKVAIAGAALQVPGVCEIQANYYAAGAGFALDDVLSAMAQVDILTLGAGAAVNPLGINATIGISNLTSSCPRLAGGQVILARKAGPTVRAYRR